MSIINAMGVLSLVLLVIPVVGAGLYVREMRGKQRSIEDNLSAWAADQRLVLVSCEERTLRPSPFLGRATASQRVYRINTLDSAGTAHAGHVLMGELLTPSIDPETYIVLWDGDEL